MALHSGCTTSRFGSTKKKDLCLQRAATIVSVTVCIVCCRQSSQDAACKEAIKRGLAAEHAMDMCEAVRCFQVCIDSGIGTFTCNDDTHIDHPQQQKPVGKTTSIRHVLRQLKLFAQMYDNAALNAGSHKAASQKRTLQIPAGQAMDRLHIP